MPMSVFNCEGIFDLTLHQKNLLSQKLNSSGVKIMPHEISNLINISKIDAIAILSTLQASGLSKNYIALYHDCEPDYAVQYMAFEYGFPSMPWTCSNCQDIIYNIDEISFGLVSIIKTPIQFI